MTHVPRILFVDDEELILDTLRRHFLNEDYEIFTANSGREGLKYLEETPIEVVISDFRMPGMNGSDFLKHVSARWPDTVRIVLSGYADMPALISLINDGEIFRFINKPWKENELKETIQEALVKHQELAEMRKLLEDSLAESEELFSSEQKERERIRQRNTDLEQEVEELKLYQAAFQCAGTPILVFDGQGKLININYAAGDHLKTASVVQAEFIADIELPEAWREAVEMTLKERKSPVQKCRLPFGGKSYEVILKPLIGYNGSEGVVAALWCYEKEDKPQGIHSDKVVKV
ncbi:response regulator [bacterium]|nr:response regulator [bacterium]